MFQRLLSRGVNDFGKQAISLIQAGELHIGNDRLSLITVCLRVILSSAIFVQHIGVAVSTIRSNGLAFGFSEDLTPSGDIFILLKLSLWPPYSHRVSLLPLKFDSAAGLIPHAGNRDSR